MEDQIIDLVEDGGPVSVLGPDADLEIEQEISNRPIIADTPVVTGPSSLGDPAGGAEEGSGGRSMPWKGLRTDTITNQKLTFFNVRKYVHDLLEGQAKKVGPTTTCAHIAEYKAEILNASKENLVTLDNLKNVIQKYLLGSEFDSVRGKLTADVGASYVDLKNEFLTDPKGMFTRFDMLCDAITNESEKDFAIAVVNLQILNVN